MTKPLSQQGKKATESDNQHKTSSKPATQIVPADDRRVLEVFDGYRGRPSNERLIDVGLYLEGDARLQGIENLLVSKGVARWVRSIDAQTMRQIQASALLPTRELVPDGFRGTPAAEGQKENGLLTPEQVAAMNQPGYEPEPDRDELGNTLPPQPDGLRSFVLNPDGTPAQAGQEGDQTEYAPEDQRPIVGSTNPENRTPVPPVVPPDVRQRVKTTPK